MIYDVEKSIWFDKIGIVKVKTKFNGIKYYIGIGKGSNQHADEQRIAQFGNPISIHEVLMFFKPDEKN